MEGIIAELECVLPPSGDREELPRESVDTRQIVTNDVVRVWTSEGVAEPLPVRFVWPKREAGKHQKVACDKRGADQQVKSKTAIGSSEQSAAAGMPR
jgi:hypothetical protein